MSHPVLLTVKEVSLLLRIHRPKVYDLIKDGSIEGFKIGSDWRVKRDSIEKMIGPIPESFFDSRKKASPVKLNVGAAEAPKRHVA